MPAWREFAAWGAASFNLQKRRRLRKRISGVVEATKASLGACVLLLQELPKQRSARLQGGLLHAGRDTDTGVYVPNTFETLVLRERVNEKYWTAVQIADTAFISIHLLPAATQAVVMENVDTMEEITKLIQEWKTGAKNIKYVVVGMDGNAGVQASQADVTGQHIHVRPEERALKRRQAMEIVLWAAEHELRLVNTFTLPEGRSQHTWT